MPLNFHPAADGASAVSVRREDERIFGRGFLKCARSETGFFEHPSGQRSLLLECARRDGEHDRRPSPGRVSSMSERA